MSEFAISPEGKNVYNRKQNAKPVTRIGNWVEELAIWEELERRKLNNLEEPTAQACIVDPTVNPADFYTTSNGQYGKFSKRKEGQTVCREPKISVIKQEYVDPRKARADFDAGVTGVRGEADILNTDLLEAAHAGESMKSTLEISQEWVEEQKPVDRPLNASQKTQTVTFWNAGDDSVRFARSSAFTKPIEEQ